MPLNWNGRFAGKRAGCWKENGYETITVNYKAYYTHRLVWMFYNGVIPPNMFVDHIDGNPKNNAITNLRIVTEHESSLNTKAKGGSSHFKGVHKSSRGNGWIAQITFKGKVRHLGTFKTEKDAEKAYDKACKLYHKEFGKLNKVEE